MKFTAITLYFLFLFSILIVFVLSYPFIFATIPKSSINPTLPDEPWYHSPEWITAIGTIGSTIGAVSIATYSFKLGRENEKKQGLRYVFQLLDDNAHRNARRIVNLYKETIDERKARILRLMGVEEKDILRKEALIKESEEIVKADFDQIGALITNKEIPKNNFIVIYWHEVLRCWFVLENNIVNIRNSLHDNNYMENFEKLKVIAEEYTKNKIKQDNFSKIIKKDIIVPPIALGWDSDSLQEDNKKISVLIGRFDEILDDLTLNKNNIYVIDENKNKSKDFHVDIQKNEKSIICMIKGGRPPADTKQYSIYLSNNVKDINGIALEREITVPIYI